MPELSPELQRYAQENGIDLSSYGVAGDPFAASTDLPVLVKAGKRAPRGTGEPDIKSEQARKQSELLRDLYATADPSALTALQRRLFLGGFYGGADATQVRWGVLDERTVQAYQGALERAGMFYAAGRKVTLDQVIDESAGSGGTGPGDIIGGRVGGANAYTVRLSDPDTLNKAADRVATEVLGRKATETERGRIVAIIQEEEQAAAQSVNTASEGQSRAQFGAALGAERAGAQAKAGGSIISPVPGQNHPADTLGADRDGGKRKHKGTDIFGPEGSAAVAPIGGEVVKVGSGGKGGNSVWIHGDDGRYHYLAHFASVGVKPGQRVEQGQQIATVGRTGNASGTAAHVHYSINSKVGAEDAVGNPAVELAGAASGIREVPSTYIPPVTTTVQDTDPAAGAERLLRQQHPAEAQAHDLATQFSTFLDLIKSPV